ncbi:MAG: hypothetical protein QXY40_02415 [Candidatus Methanomethylicia archaeon]
MTRTVNVRFGNTVKCYEVIENPIPHIVVPTTKEVVHGWFYGYGDRGRRECCSERILLNPYNGCSVSCIFCYSRGFKGYFRLWNEENIITVFKGFDVKLKEELSKLYVASCGYLSPSTDPFQSPLEEMYNLSVKAANVMLDLGLPIEFITKKGDKVPLSLLHRMAEHRFSHCFTQYTIIGIDKNIVQIFSPGSSSTEDQFKSVCRSADYGLFTIVRVDPLLPGITDDSETIEYIVSRGKHEGASHFIFSLCDLSSGWRNKTLRAVKEYFPEAYPLWLKIYSKGYLGGLNYRLKVFKTAREICDKYRVTMALCMEFKILKDKGRLRYVGLNEEFMTSRNCEGVDIPIYYRRSLRDEFKPLEGCNGNCLFCAKGSQQPVCGEYKLMRADALKLKDYIRFKPSILRLSS